MMKKTLAAASIAALLVLTGCSGEKNDDPLKDGIPSNDSTAPAQPDPNETTKAPAPEEEPTGDPNDPKDISDGISVGEDFVEAYNEQSYSDDSPNSWIEAVKPYMTPRGYKEFTGDIDPDDGGMEVAQWEKHRISQEAVVTSSDWIPGYRHSPDEMSIYVVFDLKAESDGHPYDVQDTMYLDLVREDDAWKVAEINNSKDIQKALGGQDAPEK